MSGSERLRRITDNEARVKALNEGLRSGTRIGAKTDVVCECGHADCIQRLDISDDEWAKAHHGPDRYVVALGHELPDAERTLATNDRFSIVEKLAG